MAHTHIFHGPIIRTVADAALMFSVMAGPSGSDPSSVPDDGTDYASAIEGDVTGWRVAWSPDQGLGHVDPEVVAGCADAVRAFESLGALVEEATPDWGNPEESMWKGPWVPGYPCEYDVLDWKSQSGEVDDQLFEIFAQAETLTARSPGGTAPTPRSCAPRRTTRRPGPGRTSSRRGSRNTRPTRRVARSQKQTSGQRGPPQSDGSVERATGIEPA